MKITPIQLCIKEWGTVTQFAHAIGRDSSSVSRWSRPRSEGGCDGSMPIDATRDTVLALKKRKSKITAEEILFGRIAKRSR